MLTGVRAIRVRRSPHLICHWRGATLVACNYATGVKAVVPPKAAEILAFCETWTKLEALEGESFVHRSALAAIIARMVALTLLERSDRRRDPDALAMDSLRAWNPQAGYFHTTTKNLRFASPAVVARRRLTRDRRPPAAIKRYPNRATIDLPRPGDEW